MHKKTILKLIVNQRVIAIKTKKRWAISSETNLIKKERKERVTEQGRQETVYITHQIMK